MRPATKWNGSTTVSYTHLDVYKRQELELVEYLNRSIFALSSGEKQQIAIGSVYALSLIHICAIMSELFSIQLQNRQQQGGDGVWLNLPTTTEQVQACLLYTSRCV